MIRKIHLFCFLLLLLIGNVSANDDSNATLETSDIDMCYRDGTSFDVKINELANTSVNVTINDKKTYNLITNDSGEAKLKINLYPGTYNFKTDCILDNQKLSVFNTVKVKTMNTTIVANKSIVLPYMEGDYSVSLLSGDNSKLTHKTVIFKVLGKEYKKVTDENGVATLPIRLLKGTYSISASFAEYGYCSSVVHSILNVKTLNTYLMPNLRVLKNKGEYFKVQLLDQYNRIISNHAVFISVDGKSYFVLTDNDGYATLKLNLSMGDYKIASIFYGSSGYTRSTSSITLTIDYGNYTIISNDFETVVDSNIFYLVSVKDEEDKSPNLNLKTEIYQNGIFVKTISSKILEDGIARVNLDLAPGTYTIKNYIKENSTFTESTIIIKPATVIVNSSDLNLNRKGELYTVTFKNNETNSGIANIPVYFTVVGVTYKTQTNKNGEASLKINLMNGNYTITYLFDGGEKYGEVRGTNNIYRADVLLSTKMTPLTSEIFRKGTYYEVILKDSNDIPLKNQIIYISLKKVTYKCLTDSNGIAKLKINLLDGNYQFKVEFKGNSQFKSSSNTFQLSVNTAPNFNYTLDFPNFISYNGFKCTNIREFNVNYNNKNYKLCYGENEKGFYQISDKKSYLITADGLKSSYKLQQGIEFKVDGDNLQLIFYGRSPSIGQFSVISDSISSDCNIKFIINNEVVATVNMYSFFYSDEFEKLNNLGFNYNGIEFVNSTCRCAGQEFVRSIQVASDLDSLSISTIGKPNSFQTAQSYLIDFEKISDDFIQKELDKATNFNGEYDKNAYNLYLIALQTIASSDILCDNLAEQLNVSWDKKFHFVLAEYDWLGLKLDSKVPLIVNGNESNVFAFRILHGLLFSYCEEIAIQSSGNEAQSAINTILNGIYEGYDFTTEIKDNTLTLKLANSKDSIVIDLETGVTSTYTALDMMGLLSNINLKGATGSYMPSFTTEQSIKIGLDGFKRAINGYGDILSSITPKKIFSIAESFVKDLTVIWGATILGKANPISVLYLGVEFDKLTLEYRNKYAPNSTAQYFACHDPVWEVKTVHVYNPKTYYYDCIEIPLDDKGNYIMENASYIDSVTGRRGLTENEKEIYANY